MLLNQRGLLVIRSSVSRPPHPESPKPRAGSAFLPTSGPMNAPRRRVFARQKSRLLGPSSGPNVMCNNVGPLSPTETAAEVTASARLKGADALLSHTESWPRFISIMVYVCTSCSSTVAWKQTPQSGPLRCAAKLKVGARRQIQKEDFF